MPLGPALLALLLVHPLPVATGVDPSALRSRERARPLGRLRRRQETEYTAILAEGYARMAGIYSAEKKFAEAVPLLEAATHYRRDSDSLRDLGVARFYAKQYDAAVEPLREAIVLNPRSLTAQRMLGKVYLLLRDYKKAAGCLNAALQLEPNDFETTFTLGIVYLEQREYAAAKQVYDRMIQQLGDQPRFHLVIGHAYREAGLLANAIEEFKKAIALDPRLRHAHVNLGLAYLRDKGAESLDAAERGFMAELESANTTSSSPTITSGIVYIYKRKWEPAIGALQKASRARPDNPDPRFQLGQAHQEVQQHDRAIEALRKAIALDPDLAHNKFQVTAAHYRLAQSLLKTGRTEAGQAELRLAAELKAKAFVAQQKSGAGAEAGSAPFEQDDRLAPATSARSAEDEASSLDEASLEELKRAEAYSRRLSPPRTTRSDSCGLKRRTSAARAPQVRPRREMEPTTGGSRFDLGLARYKTESYAEAVPAPLENELEVHPDNIAARWLLGLSCFMLGDSAKTSEMLRDVAASDSTNMSVLYALASSLLDLGKASEAHEVIQRIAAQAPGGPATPHPVGRERFARGDSPGALAEFEAAAKLGAQDPFVHREFGRAYIAAGRKEEGRRELEVSERLRKAAGRTNP